MPSWNRLAVETAKTQSDVVAASGTITLDVPEPNQNYSHNFISIEFFSDAAGTPATPTGGSLTYGAKLLGSAIFQDTNNQTQQAASAGVGDFAGNPTQVRAVLTSIAGATHCRLTLAGNNS